MIIVLQSINRSVHDQFTVHICIIVTDTVRCSTRKKKSEKELNRHWQWCIYEERSSTPGPHVNTPLDTGDFSSDSKTILFAPRVSSITYVTCVQNERVSMSTIITLSTS